MRWLLPASLVLAVALLVGQSGVRAQTAEDTVGGLTLTSDEPGVLAVAWDAHDPLPTDYQVNWGESSEDFPSFREDDGNAYPTTNSYIVSGLEEGVEYQVRVRARYRDTEGNGSSSAWSETARLVVTSSTPDDSSSTPDHTSAVKSDAPPVIPQLQVVVRDDEPTIVRPPEDEHPYNDDPPLGLLGPPYRMGLNPQTRQVHEGEVLVVEFFLITKPLDEADVMISITSDNPDVTFGPTTVTLTATPDSWSDTTTLTFVPDLDAFPDVFNVTFTPSGGGYTADHALVAVFSMLEDETAGLTVTPDSLTLQEGDSDQYTVVLDGQPSGDVQVAITSNNADVTVMPEELTFTTTNWSQAQRVTVTAAGDADATDDTATLRHQFSGGNYSGFAILTVTVTDLDEPTTTPVGPTGPSGLGGGGGGGPTGPSPSEVDFEWNVKRDIEALASRHNTPTGAWSDGSTLWVLENGAGADDGVYAYDLESGDRVEDREFELDQGNRAPRGIWSDRVTTWVSDSGQDRLFAYDSVSGDRIAERDIELAEGNRNVRGIWSDGETLWVLDGGRDALFTYDLANGAFIAEYALDPSNGDPRGLWSDGVTIWVSDHGAKQLFAYRLPPRPADDAEPGIVTAAQAETGDESPQPLERVRDEEFTELSRASNNSPRGIWSDGDVIYVVDASDGRVYTYNMPDAIDARLASLSLSGIDIGEFDPGRTDYEGVAAEGVTETIVTAEAMQRRTDVAIDPPDADGDESNGYQVALDGLGEITVTVTSADGSRRLVYRVRFAGTPPWPHCLRGDVAEGFSLVVHEGGSVDDLIACATGRGSVSLYVLDGGVYVSYIVGAPDFVNADFRELFQGGVPSFTPLVVKSEGPVSADPFPGAAVTTDWSGCLRGEAAPGFSLAVYAGGAVDELEACMESRDLAAVYVLDDGDWVSYILGAPEFVNARFRELFPDGVPAVTPLTVKRETSSAAGSELDDASGS